MKKFEKELQTEFTPLLVFTVHQMINDIWQKLRKIQQDARQHRQLHLEELA